MPRRRSPAESVPEHSDASTATTPTEDGEPPSSRPGLTRAHLLVVGAVTVAALGATLLVLWSAQPRSEAVPLAVAATPPAAASQAATPAPTLAAMGEASAVTGEADELAEVVVHVAGKVRRPGVVRLPATSRVIDAIEAAGGARKGADLSAVNLARELEDGEQVRVGLPPDPNVSAVGGRSATAASAGSGPTAPEGTLDLNAASAEELESLPGVGPVLAERIVAYREETAAFQTVDQLIEVPGIGPAVLAGLEDLVRV